MEQTQHIDISLIPDENDGNPRKITKAGIDRLKKSIKENADFFEARPILLNRKENGELQIIGGHQRLRAARELKLEKVPAFVFDNLDARRPQKDIPFSITITKANGISNFCKTLALISMISTYQYRIRLTITK